MNEKNGEDLKIFTMRNIPEAVRQMWKIICVREGVTMEEFALQAIKEKIENYSTNIKQNVAVEDNAKA